MTTRRVIIDPTASSPLRVSVVGVDASGASFDDLLFDANQVPMRVYLNGWMFVPVMGVGIGAANWAYGPSYPSGYPMFMVMFNQLKPDSTWDYGSGCTPFWENTSGITGGAGGSVTGSQFVGITFMQDFMLPSGQAYNFPEGTRVGYCILRNYE